MSNETHEKVMETIRKLEQNVNDQKTIDEKYEAVKLLFNDELVKLPNKSSNNAKSNKQFRKGQSFWNDELAKLWDDYCTKEKHYLDFKIASWVS